MTMTPFTYDARALREYQADVCHLLGLGGVESQLWHSGGGIVGVRIVTPAGNVLFTTFETAGSPGAPAWTGFDYDDAEGELIGSLEIQVRPFGAHERHGSAEEMTRGVLRLLRALA